MLLRFLLAATLTAAAFAPGTASAQPTPADTTALRLRQLLRETVQDNPTLRAARLRADALSYRPKQAGALPDPTASLGYQPRPILTARGYQRSQWQVQQQIPFPGKRRLRREVAALGARVAASDADALEQDLALQLKQSYYELYRAQEQVQLIRQFQTQLEGFEEAATTRYEVGEGSQQAILKAQIERGRLSVKLEALAAERQSALEALARLTGRAELEAPAAPVQAVPPALPLEAGGLAAALEARPEAEALRRRVVQADRRIALARRAFLPDFTLGATYSDLGGTDLAPAMTGRDAVSLSVSLKIPLWLDKQRARLEEAQLQKRRADTRLEALQLEIQAELDDLRSQFRRQERQLALLEETLVPQAETALEATLNAYAAGHTDFINLLDAERTLFQLQMEREATYARYLTTAARLERALGRAALPPSR